MKLFNENQTEKSGHFVTSQITFCARVCEACIIGELSCIHLENRVTPCSYLRLIVEARLRKMYRVMHLSL